MFTLISFDPIDLSSSNSVRHAAWYVQPQDHMGSSDKKVETLPKKTHMTWRFQVGNVIHLCRVFWRLWTSYLFFRGKANSWKRPILSPTCWLPLKIDLICEGRCQNRQVHPAQQAPKMGKFPFRKGGVGKMNDIIVLYIYDMQYV